VLPAWATVAISLGSAAIGAFAGFGASWLTYRGGRITQNREESLAWRNLQLEACKAMSDAWLEFRWLLYVPSLGHEFDDTAYGRVGPLGTSCAQCIARVVLLVGADKPGSAGAAAGEVDKRISQLKDTALKAQRRGRRRVWSAESRAEIAREIKYAEEAHEAFVKRAHLEVRPTEPQDPAVFRDA
jgi:hypothetical protein